MYYRFGVGDFFRSRSLHQFPERELKLISVRLRAGFLLQIFGLDKICQKSRIANTRFGNKIAKGEDLACLFDEISAVRQGYLAFFCGGPKLIPFVLGIFIQGLRNSAVKFHI